MKHEPVKDHAERKRLLALIERCEKEQTMSDALIKREDVLNVLKLYGYLPLDSLYYTIEHDLPSADIDLSEYSDKLWRNAYERGKAEEHRWWSEHCAKCTDADRPQGEWVRYMGDIWTCSACGENLMCDDIECNNYCPNCGARMKGANDECR